MLTYYIELLFISLPIVVFLIAYHWKLIVYPFVHDQNANLQPFVQKTHVLIHAYLPFYHTSHYPDL